LIGFWYLARLSDSTYAIVSWLLMPGIATQRCTKLGRFVKNVSRVTFSLVGKLTIWIRSSSDFVEIKCSFISLGYLLLEIVFVCQFISGQLAFPPIHIVDLFYICSWPLVCDQYLYLVVGKKRQPLKVIIYTFYMHSNQFAMYVYIYYWCSRIMSSILSLPNLQRVTNCDISIICEHKLKQSSLSYFHFKYFIDKSIGLDNRLCLCKSSPTTRWNN
jgi:hypothetical protein